VLRQLHQTTVSFYLGSGGSRSGFGRTRHGRRRRVALRLERRRGRIGAQPGEDIGGRRRGPSSSYWRLNSINACGFHEKLGACSAGGSRAQSDVITNARPWTRSDATKAVARVNPPSTPQPHLTMHRPLCRKSIYIGNADDVCCLLYR
jgi:hypothetical protein